MQDILIREDLAKEHKKHPALSFSENEREERKLQAIICFIKELTNYIENAR